MSGDWHQLLADAIATFGDTPGPDLERRLADAYATHQGAVIVTLRKVTEQHRKGTVNSPWGLVRAELDKQIQVRANIPATTDRAVKERNAEQWIRTCGLHYDRWTELHDELFGDRGPLRPWADDQVLEARVRRVYDEARPAGEHLERQEHERAERWTAHRQSKPKATIAA